MLINEQLQQFYNLQPQQGSLGDSFFIIEKLPANHPKVANQEISFGNQQVLKDMIERNNGAEPRSNEQEPSIESAPLKEEELEQEGLNPFKIRDDTKCGIVPNRQEIEEREGLKLKIPSGILKSSNGPASNETDSDYIDLSHRDIISDRKRVDFLMSQASKSKSDFSQSVFDSQLQSSQQQTGRSLQKASIGSLGKLTKRTRKLSDFLKKAGGDNTFEEALDQEVISKLDDLMLIEFPVFALNEDYMRALAIIIEHKLEQIRSIITSQVQIKTQRSIPTLQEQPEELKSIETNGQHAPLRVRYQHFDHVAQPQITESQL